MRSILSREKGFTLLECVVTLVIVGFIGAVITATMAYGVRIYQALLTQSVMTDQVHVAAAAIKRLVEQTELNKLNVVKNQFLLDNGTVYWTYESVKNSVLLEQVSDWSITAKNVKDVGSDSRSFVELSITLNDSAGTRYVYEFHPKWEAQ